MAARGKKIIVLKRVRVYYWFRGANLPKSERGKIVVTKRNLFVERKKRSAGTSTAGPKP